MTSCLTSKTFTPGEVQFTFTKQKNCDTKRCLRLKMQMKMWPFTVKKYKSTSSTQYDLRDTDGDAKGHLNCYLIQHHEKK